MQINLKNFSEMVRRERKEFSFLTEEHDLGIRGFGFRSIHETHQHTHNPSQQITSKDKANSTTLQVGLHHSHCYYYTKNQQT